MNSLKNRIPLILAGAFAVLCYGFFFFKYAYHLFYREQITLFLNTWTNISTYTKIGGLSPLMGDYLTQFFYLKGMGPAILTLFLLVIGILIYLGIKELTNNKITAIFIAGVICFLEGLWECGSNYPLSETVCLTGASLMFYLWSKAPLSGIIANSVSFLLFGIVQFFLFGLPSLNQREFKKPNFALEHLLALDSEAYFGNWDKVADLSQKDTQNYINTYYHNLALFHQGKLTSDLLGYYQPYSKGLLLPVNQEETYFSILAANEAWFELGDMTTAEHATLLGMIFSPKHTGTRALRRLAEINLVQGETKAAQKYLHLLSLSVCHKKWALEHMPGKQTKKVRTLIKQKQSLLPVNDTLRIAGESRISLRNLLNSHPQNAMAQEYLLCYDLLNKNLKDFAEDYQQYANGTYQDIYAEALLIIQTVKPEWLKNVKIQINQDKLQAYKDYMEQWNQHPGDALLLKEKYGKTYWYYYHFAKHE